MRRVSNADLAEVLAESSRNETGMREKALKRAARSAFLWPEEAAQLLADGRNLEELHGVGPFIAAQLRKAIENAPTEQAPSDPLREDFLTRAEACAILSRDPTWEPRLRGDLHMHTS